MIQTQPSLLDLIRLHVETLYIHNERARLLAVNQWDGGSVPRFFLGRTIAGNIWRFRHDISDNLIQELETICKKEPVVNDLSQAPKYQDTYLELLSNEQPVESVWTGPVYWFEAIVKAKNPPVAIDETNASLLAAGMDDWLPDVPHRRPFVVAVEDGHAVAVCASVRITDAAHEAGVETWTAYRRKGHAFDAVAGWAQSVHELGAIPLYSTSWENTASQNVAAKMGLSIFGADFHIT
ncbi:MAG: GNAT family N-acetyltransferase [Pseudomonadota bacterium]